MKKILLIDMHNTLVDEAKEYGPAIDAAIDVFIETARKHKRIGDHFDAEKFKHIIYDDLRRYHRDCGDDWDNRAFDKEQMPHIYSLLSKNDALYEDTKRQALIARSEYSRQYIQTHAYPGALEFIREAKQQGDTVYVVTDANSVAAESTLHWLGLDGAIDGVFCPASSSEAAPLLPKLQHTQVTYFAPGSFKPDAAIVADILLQHAKKEHRVPENTTRDDLFTLRADDTLPAGASPALKYKLSVRADAPHADAIRELMKNTIGIGDDYRDHLLFHNAGITSIAADYGKAPESDAEVIRGKAILKAVTGWAPERLELLQAVGGKSWAAQVAKPDLHCRESLLEALPLLTHGAKAQRLIM